MTTVTLLLFSGRPDPTWELTADEAAALGPALQAAVPASESSILGYRGFLVQSSDPGLPPKLFVRHSPGLERLLLRTGEGRLPSEIIRAAAEAIE